MLKIPKNVMQIGTGSPNVKLYMEDYVHTFLERCQGKETCLAFGQQEEKDGIRYYLIYGVEKETDFRRGNFSYFQKLERIGKIEKKEAAVRFWTVRGEEIQIGGYFIFYEQNEEMQAYMIAEREQSRPADVEEERVMEAINARREKRKAEAAADAEEYGEGLAEHLRYHNNKILGIVNGIDTDIWNPATDKLLAADYDEKSAIKNKKINKKALQESLGLEVDEHKMVIGLISRLTNQKGLDLVNDVIPGIMDEHTQVVVLGTGDSQYENTFRYYENKYKGNFCAYIAYNENVAHNIYAGCDALLVPSRFEPCGLTQLIAMRYGAVPIVRETGGLKDTVQPYNMFENTGNGFTFDRYESGLLYDAINRAKTLYFENRKSWDDMVIRDMNKDVSWEKSAKQYKDMYVGLTPRD